MSINNVVLTDDGLILKGNLTFSNVSSVLKEGCKQLENHKASSIIIDLSKVEKIDSAGITLLLAWKRLCESSAKSFVVKGAQQQVKSLITTNKMHKILNVNY